MKKDIYDIDILLDKYFEGESSLDEERILRGYFCKDNLPEKYIQYKPLFDYFSEQNSTVENLDKGLELDSKKTVRGFIWKIAIVAGFAILITGGILTKNMRSNADNQTIAYIDGAKVSDITEINTLAIQSLSNISEVNEDVANSQIDILDSFIE